MRAKFVLRCREDLVVLQRGEDAAQLRTIVHRIAGAAGMFGHDQLGALALDLDQLGLDGQALTPGALAKLERALEVIVADPGPRSAKG